MDEISDGSRPWFVRGRRLAAIAVAVLLAAGGTALAVRSGDHRNAEPPLSASTGTTSHKWQKIVPAGDCQCANGSRFHFWDRAADPTRVVLFLDGGGVCWDATMCAFTSTDSPGENDLYDWTSDATEDPGDQQGFFELDRADNPFAGYSAVFAAGCTGDAFLGDTSQKLSPKLTVQHRGFINGAAVLDYLAGHYPKATQVVVIGKTAGSIGAPIYGGLVADRLPHAKVTVFGAQSGAWPNDPDFNTKVLGRAWGAYRAVPAWATKGLALAQWGIPEFSVEAARHAPGLVLSRFDYAYDPAASREVTKWIPGHPPDALAVIDANEKAIEQAGVPLHSYTAPGRNHGLFEFDTYYDLKVDGVALTDWLKRLITGRPATDVHCTACTG